MPAKSNREALSVFAWVLTLIVLAIPCVGLIFTIAWAIADKNESRQNFCRATLVLWLIAIALYAIGLALGMGPQLGAALRDWIPKS